MRQLVCVLTFVLLRSDCHFFPSDPQKYLFSSPTEICHWNSTVWDSVSPPESPEDSSEVSSLSAESRRSSSSTMENRSHRPNTGSSQWSPESKPENMPQPYQTGPWLDQQLPGNSPFSPVLSDFTLATSEDSFASLAPVYSQELFSEPFASTNWSSQLTDHSYIDESAVSEHNFIPFQDNSQPEIMPAGYQSWFSPSEVNFEQYFQLERPQGHMTGYTPITSQTAGFVGSAPVVPSSQPGSSYQVTGHTNGHLEPALPGNMPGHPLTGHNGPFLPSSQVTDTQQPRRLSVAVNSPVAWTPEEAKDNRSRSSQGYNSGLHAVPILSSHPVPHVSGIPSAPSSVSHVKVERSMSACSTVSAGARSEDSEGKPRSHKYYTTARPHSDGYYHCPYVVSEKCPHKPTKLKCNYE